MVVGEGGPKAMVYLCLPGRMIYPRLPEIDEELIKLKHFEAIHDLCMLASSPPLKDLSRLLTERELRQLLRREEVIVGDVLRLAPILRLRPPRGSYAVVRLRKSF